MTAETVQSTSQANVKYRFRAPMHLLVAYEEGERSDGETFVEGLPRSTLRNFARKLCLKSSDDGQSKSTLRSLQ
jgi:AraC family transcriptional regulator